MTDPDHPLPVVEVDGDVPSDRLSLATEAPLARGAVIASLSAVLLGFCFLPQLLGLALAGLSLARRERAGQRHALLAAAISVVLTVLWGIALGLLITWWAGNRGV